LDEEVKEEEDDDDDEQEWGSGRGDRAGEEEEVGWEWVDMTNLGTDDDSSKDHSDALGCRNSINIKMCKRPLLPTHIYSPRTSRKPKRHKISTVRSA